MLHSLSKLSVCSVVNGGSTSGSNLNTKYEYASLLYIYSAFTYPLSMGAVFGFKWSSLLNKNSLSNTQERGFFGLSPKTKVSVKSTPE